MPGDPDPHSDEPRTVMAISSPPTSETTRPEGVSASRVLFLGSVALVSLQLWPRMPLPSMQLSDAVFAVAALGFVPWFVRNRRSPLQPIVTAAVFTFLLGATVSAIVNGGSFVKLLGHAELAALGVISAVVARSAPGERRVRQALLAAALLAGCAGLIGAGLYYVGVPTALLNHSGDLLTGNYPRIRGTCGKANMLASVLATGILLLAADPRLMPGRAARALSLAALLVALLFTFSRTIPECLLGLMALWAFRRPTPARAVVVVVALLVLLAALFVSVRYEVLLNPARFWEVSVADRPATRWVFWSAALDAALVHPWTGIGPGRLAAGVMDAHLAWLNLWALLGPVPLMAFACLVVAALRNHRVSPGAALALGVVTLTSLHCDVEDMRHVWILFGVLLHAPDEAALPSTCGPLPEATSLTPDGPRGD